MSQKEIIYVKAKCSWDLKIRNGILIDPLANGTDRIKTLYFNTVIRRLDWIIYEVYAHQYNVIKRVFNNQFLLF